MRYTVAVVCLAAATVNAFNLNGTFESIVKPWRRAYFLLLPVHGKYPVWILSRPSLRRRDLCEIF